MNYITTTQIAAMVGLSKNYVTEKIVRQPDFPRPAMMLSRKTRRWDLADVQMWMDRQRKKCLR